MSFILGTRSRQALVGVHPHLVQVVQEAIKVTSVDFTVIEGVRTLERQRQLVREGKSQTMNSRHITGHAVDLAPYVRGTIDWNTWSNFEAIAEVVRRVAIDNGVEVLWGAAWLMSLNYYPSAKAATAAYTAERKKANRTPFIDGPHFQLSKRMYP